MKILIALLSTVTLSAGAVEPESFRARQAINAAPSDSVDAARAEIAFGRDVAARILGRFPLENNASLQRYINLVGKGVALHAPRPELEYRFGLVRAAEVNAYATPGGYIFITTGALAQMQDESELAAVLAHEVAHVTEQHIVKTLNLRTQSTDAQAGIAHLIGGAGDAARVAFMQLVDKAVEILFEKGLTKAEEMDADRLATLIATSAGYDPHALPRYFERIRALNKTSLAQIRTTHPSFDDRIVNLQRLLNVESLNHIELRSARERFHENIKNKP